MKIARVEEKPSERAANGKRRSFGEWGRAWYVQAAVLLVAFLLGAVVYRSGIVRPTTQFLRLLVTRGPQAAILPAPAQEAAKNVQDEVRMYENNGLPTLYIDLPFKNYQKLLDKRNEALKLGILNTTDADFVNGQVKLQNGPKLDVKLRLKGDWTDHLVGDKWSFRVQLKEDGSILGTRQFNLEAPDTRNFLYEWAFHKNLIQESVLTTRFQYVNVLLNGKLLGIYALEEHFAPELIESQGRRQGLILRYDENLMWDSLSNFWANHVVQGEGSSFMITNGASADIAPFGTGKIAKDATLTEEAQAAMDLLRAYQTGQRPASEVFDVNLMGRFFAMSDLWSGCHGLAWHNLRFYYNPVTGRLEPIAYDVEPFHSCDPNATIISELIKTGIFNDPQIRAAYARELQRITQPAYLDTLVSGLSKEHDQLQSALKVEYPQDAVNVDWEQLKARARALSTELKPAQPVRGTYQALNVQPGAAEKPILVADLINLMVLPVEVQGVEIDGKMQPVSLPATLAPVTNPATQVFASTRVTIPLKDTAGLEPGASKVPTVNVVVKLAGLEGSYRVPLSGVPMPEGRKIGPVPHQPTVAEALRQHPFLTDNPERKGTLLVTPGTWDVQGDLIMPLDYDLIVPAGTTLRFSKGSIFYANGSLSLLGTAGAPVLLTAQQDGWGGIVVLNTTHDSVWQYAAVEKTAGIDRDGWVMTGGITFFKSTIITDHVLLGNNKTEDAINVIHGTFKFQNSEWENTQADAIDSDFSTGEVTGCYFHDIAGDAVDVSGTQATVSGTRMERITDKGVSVGEASHITVKDTKMDTVGIGVASKDLSKAFITKTEIRKARFSALAAYIKKPVYGPASIEAPDVTILDTEKEAVVQKGSTILLRGKPVETVDLNVDLLYQEGILGN